MEKGNNQKIDKLERCIIRQSQEIRKLKKRPERVLTEMKFVGVAFDPEKYKSGETQVNHALANGFEVIRDFETGGGIVMALGKWVKKDER
jgi:hypothetical protein